MKTLIKKIDDVTFITLDNELGLTLVLCTLGASIYDIELIDNHNHKESIVLTPSNLTTFYNNTGYYGKSIGRFSGRIDKARCKINDVTYNLDVNWNNTNSLHGEENGIAFANFDYEIKEENDFVDVIFRFVEKENHLPGDISYEISYRVSKTQLDFTNFFKATTNKDTLVNLTNHSYFNLSGNGKRTILDHNLQLNCDKYTRLNNEMITISVDKVNKVMDFQKAHKINKYIEDDSLINHQAFGYDHCFIKKDLNEKEIAILEDKKSHRKLILSTSYPTVVCYSLNYPLDVDFLPTNFKASKYHAITLECQYIPNGINMENQDKAILRKGEVYNEYVNYHFIVK